MRISYLPVLGTLRELYQQPRDMQRFRNYVAALTGGTDDLVLPIVVANPMAREHAVARLEEFPGLEAEEVGAAAAAEAEQRLADVPGDESRASVVLADDLGGGWTNRYTTEASVRFPGRGALKRPFAVALVWTSESPTPDTLRQEVLAAVYRLVHQRRHSVPARLRDMLAQEGLAQAFAGATPRLAGEQLARARDVIGSVLDSAIYGEAFAGLYGDADAEQLGYRALGLPPRAGFEVALADALELRADPLAALRA